jgi:hypothetical protein
MTRLGRESGSLDADAADLVFARAREPYEGVSKLERAEERLTSSISIVSGCAFVFVDQAAEQVTAMEPRIGWCS